MDNGNIEKKADLRAEVEGLNRSVGGVPIVEVTKVPMEAYTPKRLMNDAEKRVEITRILKRLNEKLKSSNEDEELIKGLKKKKEDEEWIEKKAENEDSGNDYGDLEKFLESKKLPVEETSEDVVEKPEEEPIPVVPQPKINRLVNSSGKVINLKENMIEEKKPAEEIIRKPQQEDLSATKTSSSENTPVPPTTKSGDWREDRKKEGEVGAAQTAIEQIKMYQARHPKTDKPEPVKPEPVESEPVEPKRRLSSFRKAIEESKRMSNFRKEIKEAKEKGNL